jgi:hypothetical protein
MMHRARIKKNEKILYSLELIEGKVLLEKCGLGMELQWK